MGARCVAVVGGGRALCAIAVAIDCAVSVTSNMVVDFSARAWHMACALVVCGRRAVSDAAMSSARASTRASEPSELLADVRARMCAVKAQMKYTRKVLSRQHGVPSATWAVACQIAVLTHLRVRAAVDFIVCRSPRFAHKAEGLEAELRRFHDGLSEDDRMRMLAHPMIRWQSTLRARADFFVRNASLRLGREAQRAEGHCAGQRRSIEIVPRAIAPASHDEKQRAAVVAPLAPTQWT